MPLSVATVRLAVPIVATERRDTIWPALWPASPMARG